tara:strand:- start:15399 stop:16004 length:606 start_codon:yes stop_codon:yes gene_type:complete
MKTNIKTLRFKNHKTGDVCRIKLEINDRAILREHLEIEVTGWYFKASTNQQTKVVFVVKLDARENVLYIIHNGDNLGTINLNHYIELGDTFDELEANDAFRKIADQVEENYDTFTDPAEAIELIINRLPAVDPIMGCFIKSGLSTSIGQIIRCNNTAQRELRGKRKVWELLKCLGQNKWNMVSKFTWRVLRCIGAGGWDIF